MALYQVISQFIIPLMGRFICRFSVAQSPEASIDLHSIACGPSHFQLTLRDTAVAAGEVQGSGAPGLEHLGTLWSLFGSGICSHFGHHLELLTMRGWCVRYKKHGSTSLSCWCIMYQDRSLNTQKRVFHWIPKSNTIEQHMSWHQNTSQLLHHQIPENIMTKMWYLLITSLNQIYQKYIINHCSFP